MNAGLFEGPTITMQNLKLRDVKILGSYSSSALRVTAHEDFVTDQARQIAIEVMTYVLARKVVGDKQEMVVRTPRTWWDYLKWSHAPKWFLKRWPVRWIDHRAEVSFTRYDTYPMADVPLPEDFGRPVTLDTVEWTKLPSEVPPDAADTVFTINGRVSREREFLSRQNLKMELFSLVQWWIHENYQPFFTEDTATRNPPPSVVIEAVLAALEAMGLNLGELVQRQQAEQARYRGGSE